MAAVRNSQVLPLNNTTEAKGGMRGDSLNDEVPLLPLAGVKKVGLEASSSSKELSAGTHGRGGWVVWARWVGHMYVDRD